MKKSLKFQILAFIGGDKFWTLTSALLFFCIQAHCYGQGKLTFTFEGQPVGASQQVGGYTASGMHFYAIPFGAFNMPVAPARRYWPNIKLRPV